MYDRNSPEEIYKWIRDVLDDGLKRKSITEGEYSYLAVIGKQLLEKSMWRGNISEAWKKLGYGSDKLNDLYL